MAAPRGQLSAWRRAVLALEQLDREVGTEELAHLGSRLGFRFGFGFGLGLGLGLGPGPGPGLGPGLGLGPGMLTWTSLRVYGGPSRPSAKASCSTATW